MSRKTQITNTKSTPIIKEKGNRNDVHFFIKFILCGLIIIFSLSIVAIILIFCFNKKFIADGVEATFITTGISIIGIAIAVWAGLNIIQVLEKGKLDELKEEVDKLVIQRQEISYQEFLKNLSLLDDELNVYLFRQFSNTTNLMVEVDFFTRATEYEREFQTFYLMHQTKAPFDKLKAHELIKTLENEQLNTFQNQPDSLINKYLSLRMAETYFYLAYDCSNNEAIGLFREAIKKYMLAFPALQQKYDTIMIEDNVILTAYMLNTIGECYSKIMQSNIEIIKEDIECADKYFQQLHQIIDDNKNNKRIRREVYYRNYGCMLENKYKMNFFEDKHSVQLVSSLYHEALKIAMENGSIKYNTYYAFLSFGHRKMNSIINESYIEISIQSNYDNRINELVSMANEQLYVSSMAVNAYPGKIVFRKFHAFALRDLCSIYLYLNKTVEAQKYFNRMDETIEMIAALNLVNDDYMIKLLESKTELFELLKSYDQY